MCLAIPVKVIRLKEGSMATVDAGGVQTDISVALVSDVTVGEYVIVHVGFALSRLDPDEAEKTLKILAQGGIDGLPA